MNLDIMVDQAYEIGFLEQMVDRFSGDADAVEIDRQIPGMMDMPMHEGDGSMEGMDRASWWRRFRTTMGCGTDR